MSDPLNLRMASIEHTPSGIELSDGTTVVSIRCTESDLEDFIARLVDSMTRALPGDGQLSLW